MPGTFDDTRGRDYADLVKAYGRDIVAGEALYERGTNTGAFYVVVRGHVVLQVTGGDGNAVASHLAGPGSTVGAYAAFAGLVAPSTARAIEASTVLVVPVDQATGVFARAPELALAIIKDFAELGEEPRRPLPADIDLSGRSEAGEQSTDRAALVDQDVVTVPGAYDKELFFVSTYTCPVSKTRFEQLRARAGAMRPVGRDSDFRISYSGTDPTHYAIVACPGCGYASYLDDFTDVSANEVTALRKAQAKRGRYDGPNVCGVRTVDNAMSALRLAVASYDARDGGPRRIAGLYHRMAWLERGREHAEAELAALTLASEAYVRAYEADSNLSEETAMRAAYIIGDLKLRLQEPYDAFTWLTSCLQSSEIEAQAGLARMVRDRLSECRVIIERQKKSA